MRQILQNKRIGAIALSVVVAVTSVMMTASQGGAVASKPIAHKVAIRRHVVRPVHRPAPHLVSAVDMARWSRVAMCEEGGNWHVYGPRFSGGLGISNANWVIFGGRRFAWNASRATPEQQVVIAMRIQRFPPDQYGCTGAW